MKSIFSMRRVAVAFVVAVGATAIGATPAMAAGCADSTIILADFLKVDGATSGAYDGKIGRSDLLQIALTGSGRAGPVAQQVRSAATAILQDAGRFDYLDNRQYGGARDGLIGRGDLQADRC
jgi:hypothetical protein